MSPDNYSDLLVAARAQADEARAIALTKGLVAAEDHPLLNEIFEAAADAVQQALPSEFSYRGQRFKVAIRLEKVTVAVIDPENDSHPLFVGKLLLPKFER